MATKSRWFVMLAPLLGVAVIGLSCAPAAAPTPTKAPAVAPTPTKAPVAPPPPKAAAPVQRYLMGTTQTASSLYPYYVAAAKVINAKVPEVNVTVVETGAAVENINRIAKGEFDLGLVSMDTTYMSWNGMGAWEGKPTKAARLLWNWNLNPVAYVVREDSGVKKLEELDKKDFNPGMRGSATESQTKTVLEFLGIKPKWYIGGTDDALAAIKDKRIVGYAKVHVGTTIDASIMDLMTFTPIRVLGYTPEQFEKVTKTYPYYSTGEIPAGTYKLDWNKEPIRTLAFIVGTGAHERVPEELGYKITKAIIEDQRPGGEGLQAAAAPGARGLDFVKLTLQGVNTPLHPGAYKYYKELGATIPEVAVPPEIKR